MQYSIACIVVTYNRKSLLLNCLQAVASQIYKPTAVFIVDNASTDGTEDLLHHEGYINKIRNGIKYFYIQLANNMGGAGGFYEGISAAYAKKCYDAYWVMDDDGLPDKYCLFYLQQYLEDNAYIAPLVLDIENSKCLSFPNKTEKTIEDILRKYGENGIIPNHANPFNGILYKNDLVSKIGFPKKDMFIWGDECEYDERAKHHGFFPITIVKAIHMHPKDRMVFYKDILGRETIIYTNSDLRNYCKYRNTAYLLWNYKSKVAFFIFIVRYLIFFCIQRRFDFKNLVRFLSAVKESFSDREFAGHWKFVDM